MALEFSHGAIQWLSTDAVSTTYTVSGLSFQPKAIRFYWIGIQSASNAASQTLTGRRGLGFASSTSSRRCVGSRSTDAAAAADTDTIACDDCVAVTTNGAGAADGKLDLNSITSDGFTLIVDDQVPASITVFWEAWGGDDITDVTIGDIAEPAATGTQNYTATGFVTSPSISDQVVMFGGVQSTAAVNTGAISDSGMTAGFASGTAGAKNVHLTGNSDEASLTMDTDRYYYIGECLSMITVAGGNPSARATLSAFGTDIFTLNWLARATTNRRYIYMAIKGGVWDAGGLTIAANTLNATATVSGLPFTPKGLSTIYPQGVARTQGSADILDYMNLGSGSSTSSRQAMSWQEENGTADAEVNLCINYNSVAVHVGQGGGIQIAIDINAMNSDGFQFIVDLQSGGSAEQLFYLTFGDEPAVSPKSRPVFRRAPRFWRGPF